MAFRNIVVNFVLAAISLSLAVSCTRKEAEQKSQLSIALPNKMSSQKVGAQAFDTLMHVVINISGDGMPAIVYNWDAQDSSMTSAAGIAATPSTFNFDVPQGNNRLVQVLGVYGDSAVKGGSMQFFYGDATQAFSKASEQVLIVLGSLGAGSQITSGRVSGRYMNSTTGGPTSSVDVLYTPPGKPPMIVDSDLIVNGWFQFFMMAGVKFSYRLADGTILWNSPVELGSTPFLPSTATLRASIPLHQRQQYMNGASTWMTEDPEIYVYGFFGDPGNIAGKTVCDVTTPTTFKAMAQGNDSTKMLNRANAAAPANLSDGTLQSVYVQGGVASGTANTDCVNATSITNARFNSALKFSIDLLDGQGSDSAAGFRLPFTTSESTGQAYTITDVGGVSKNISATLLPGTETIIDSFVAFKKTVGMDFNTHSSYAPCGDIVAGQLGFTAAGTGTITGSAFNAEIAISASEADQGTLVALCPMHNGIAYDSGVWIGQWNFISYGGGGGGTGPATQIASVFYGNKVGSNICTPFFIEGRDAANNPSFLGGTGTSLSFTTDNGDTAIYTDPYCITAVSSPYNVMVDRPMFYVKSSAAATRNISVSTTGNFPTINQAISVVDTSAWTPSILADFPASINAFQCNTATYVYMVNSGTDSAVGLPSSYNITLPNVAGVTYYYTSGAPCSMVSGMASVYVGMSSPIGFIDYKYSGAGTTLDLTTGAAVGGTPSASISGGNSISVVQPGPAVSVSMNMPYSISAEYCQPFTLQSYDSMGNPAPVTAATSFSLTYNGSATLPANSGIYADMNCTSAPGGPINIAASMTSSPVYYFRWITSETVNVAATVSGSAVSFSPAALMIGNVAIGSIVAYPTVGVSFTFPSSFSGAAYPIQKGQIFGLTLEARSPLGNMVTSFNDSNPGPSGVNIQDMYGAMSCSAISWVNGVGTTNCNIPPTPDYFGSLIDSFKTGGGSSMYPMYMGTPVVRVTRPAEVGPGNNSFLLSQPFSTYTNNCQPILFARGQSSGSNFVAATVSSGSSYSASLLNYSGVTGFYSDPTCTTSITQASLSPGQSSSLIYAKMAATPPSNGLAFQADGNALTYDGSAMWAYSSSAATGTVSQFKISMSLFQYYNVCSPVMVVRSDANGAAVPAAGTENLTLSASFAVSWYSDPGCTASTGGAATLNVGETAKLVYIKPNIISGGGSVYVTNGTQTGTASGVTVQQ